MPVMAQPAKEATPLDAVTGLVVQFSVPEPVATDKVIGAEAVVTTMLPEFSILTTGCALNTTPLLVVPGVVVKISFKVPVMEKVPDVAVVSPVLVALRLKPELAVPVISHPAKVAMPLDGGDRVGGAGQRARARGEGQGDRSARAGDHVAARVFDLDHRLGAERHAVGRVAWRRGEDQLGGRTGGQREGGARGGAGQPGRRRGQAVARAGRACD